MSSPQATCHVQHVPAIHHPPLSPRHATRPLSAGSALRDQAGVSAAPTSGGGGIPASPAYASLSGSEYLSQEGGATGAGAGRGGGVDGNLPILQRNTPAAASAEASRASSRLDSLATAASGAAGAQAPEIGTDAGESQGRGVGVAGGGGGGGDGGNGVGGSGSASTGLRSAVPLPPTAVQSVASAGGDRLQRLAMAEIGFAEKDMYAPKTGETSRPSLAFGVRRGS